MKADELRERFLEFYKKRGHRVCPSDSLVPGNDPSLLFTGAGMNQFKPMFLGGGDASFRRATSCQKCIRTGDIERVGRTIGHHTFFEMLGNFSFGDYFKEEAIRWAWEFLTVELKISEELLSVSVYTDDDEAFGLWNTKIGVPATRIFRFGEGDNFWPANAPSEGPNGPCGPCSEIYYDFGTQYGCGTPDCKVGCNCGRYVEVWNLVFMQYERKEGGQLVPLPRRNIDTGMGLERLAAVMQGVPTNFHTDVFMPVIDAIGAALKVKYEPASEDGVRIRRIADHLRAVIFCINDGVIPSNEGRGYVERKILRIAVRDALRLGAQGGVLHKLVPAVVATVRRRHPDVAERAENITAIIRAEEEKFLETVEQGTIILERAVERLKTENKRILPGEEVFLLYDTYGFPWEMTASFLAEKGMQIDKNGFDLALEMQRNASRFGQKKISAEIFTAGPFVELKKNIPPTRFVGYAATSADMTILAIMGRSRQGKDVVSDKLPDPQLGHEGIIITDTTPFYGEAGGQVGDVGELTWNNGKAQVKNTLRLEGFMLHEITMIQGDLQNGQKVKGTVDNNRRANVMRNHTATHMLQSALRRVLGKHVEQAGSLVAPERLRFDFTHFKALTREEIRAIEQFVNEKIQANADVAAVEMGIEEAKKSGALMFFGDKYGDRVRVISVGDFSREFCGGTHLQRTGSIGYFKIVAESSIASGVRRIEAVTGPGAVDHAQGAFDTLDHLSLLLAVNRQGVVERTSSLLKELKELKNEMGMVRKKASGNVVENLIAGAKAIGAERIVVADLGETRPDQLRSMLDALIKKNGIAAAMLVAQSEGKQTYIIGVRNDMVSKGLNAGTIAREIGGLCGGGGGGREHLAQAGGTDASKIPDAMRRMEELARKAITGS